MKKTAILLTLFFVFTDVIAAEMDPRDGWYELRLHTGEFTDTKDSTKKCQGYPGDEFHIIDVDDNSDPKTFQVYFDDLSSDNVCIQKNRSYTVNQSDLTTTHWKRSRITHGLLVVPFKLRNHDKSLAGESTLGYYIGWENNWLQASSGFVAAAGLTLIPTQNQTTNEIEEKTGVSAAIGWVFKAYDGFQVGALVGIDHLGGTEGKNWQYENDPWLSLSIGFDFAQ